MARYTYKLKNVSPLSLSSMKEIVPRIVYSTNNFKYSRMSRYSPYRIIIDSNKKKYFETQNNTVIEESDKDRYVTVDNSTINRLDKIAYSCYGVASYWWIIAKANNIIDPFDVPYDTILRIPNINSVYSSKGVVTSG